MYRKKTKFKFLFFLSTLILIFILKTSIIHAATLFLSPPATEIKIGETFNVELRINSEGQAFNAAQSTIEFPLDILEVESLDYSPAMSTFNFWLEEPTFSNQEGKITFIGGTTGGVTGASIQILKITFKAKGVGEGNILINDAAITASDGNGTNILSTIEIARFRSLPIIISPELPPPTPQTTSTPAETPKTLEITPPPPKQIIREPIIVKRLPEIPIISVPLYSDQNKWYNFTTNFLVQWNLSEDISAISTAINQNSTFDPPTKSEGLFNSKIFPALTGDGIWYLHIRFKNNVGWGPTTHYKLAIDTIPPLAFDINVLDGLSTDNPSPSLKFETTDGLSGLQNYLVRIENNDTIILETGTTTLSLQDPGIKAINIRAQDFAGNTREKNIEIEILPISSPSITFINKEEVFAGENDIFVSGLALPNIHLYLIIKDGANITQSETMTHSHTDGTWTAQIKGPFKKGQHFVEVFAQDERGAKSLTIASELFNIKTKPILILGKIKITTFWFFSGLIILTLIIFITGWFSHLLWKKQAKRKGILTQRDITNNYNHLINTINKILKKYKSDDNDSSKIAETKYLLKDAKKTLKKGKIYINDQIKDINE